MAIGATVRATATTTGGLKGMAYTVPVGIRPMAEPTDKRGLITWLKVTPEEPQELVWLTPQVGIDYYISTSSALKWQIK